MQQAVNISPLVHSDTGALRLSPYICYQQVSVLHCLTKYSCWELPLCTERHIHVASFPCCLPLCFLDSICDLWITQRSGRRLRISPTSSNCKVWIRLWCNVDSVSVIMATCPHTRMATDSKRHKTTQVLSRFHIYVMSWSSPPCGLNTQEVYQTSSHFSGRFKGHVCGQDNRAGDGLGMRLSFSAITRYI